MRLMSIKNEWLNRSSFSFSVRLNNEQMALSIVTRVEFIDIWSRCTLIVSGRAKDKYWPKKKKNSSQKKTFVRVSITSSFEEGWRSDYNVRHGRVFLLFLLLRCCFFVFTCDFRFERKSNGNLNQQTFFSSFSQCKRRKDNWSINRDATTELTIDISDCICSEQTS